MMETMDTIIAEIVQAFQEDLYLAATYLITCSKPP